MVALYLRPILLSVFPGSTNDLSQSGSLAADAADAHQRSVCVRPDLLGCLRIGLPGQDHDLLGLGDLLPCRG